MSKASPCSPGAGDRSSSMPAASQGEVPADVVRLLAAQTGLRARFSAASARQPVGGGPLRPGAAPSGSPRATELTQNGWPPPRPLFVSWSPGPTFFTVTRWLALQPASRVGNNGVRTTGQVSLTELAVRLADLLRECPCHHALAGRWQDRPNPTPGRPNRASRASHMHRANPAYGTIGVWHGTRRHPKLRRGWGSPPRPSSATA